MESLSADFMRKAMPPARRGRHRWVRGWRRLQRAKERDQVGLLLVSQLCAEHQIEELDGVFEREQAVVVQIRRRIFDAAQREGLDGAVGAGLATVNHLLVEEALDAQVVHGVVGVIGRRVAGGTLGLAKEERLSAQLVKGSVPAIVELVIDALAPLG